MDVSRGPVDRRPVVIGVDVGGTKTRAAIVDLGASEPTVLDQHVTASEAGTAVAVDRIEEAVAAVLARHDGPAVEAIGLGLAGFVGLDGIVVSAPNTAGLVGIDVAGRLRRSFGVPVTVDNDANCAALSARAALGSDVDTLVAVTLGTGIGGGIIVGGHLVRGGHGFAGEPGHMVIEADGPLCECGQRGCWEQFGSGTGLARLAAVAAGEGRAAAVVAAAGSLEAIRGEHVTELLSKGDPGASQIFESWLRYVALGISNLVMLLDPSVVVVGGGMSELGDVLIDGVRRHLAAEFPTSLDRREVHLVAASRRSDAGVIGAALVAVEGPPAN